MQDEIQNETKKSSREMWLFLIFLDLIATCVFGFFIYKSFFGLPQKNGEPVKSTEPFLEDVLVEDIKAEPQEVVLTPAPAVPAQEQQASAPAAKEEVKKEEAAPAEVKKEEPKEEVKKEEPKKEETKKAEAKKIEAKKEVQPKKKSVFISGSGKTRKVTFKYYGNAKKVSVVGGFTMSRPVALKKSGKEWSTSVVIFPGTYKYMFIVDGKTMQDPNGRSEDGKSVFTAK